MNLFRYRRLALAVLVALITIVGLVTMHVVVGYFPWQSGSFPEDVSWKMVSAARMLGVLVPLLIMVQVSLVVRIPLCNALFGLPGLIRAHRILAGIIVVLALGHFLLILVSGTRLSSLYVGIRNGRSQLFWLFVARGSLSSESLWVLPTTSGPGSMVRS